MRTIKQLYISRVKKGQHYRQFNQTYTEFRSLSLTDDLFNPFDATSTDVGHWESCKSKKIVLTIDVYCKQRVTRLVDMYILHLTTYVTKIFHRVFPSSQ